MKRLKWLVLCSVILSATDTFSENRCLCPYGFSAELLYWKPCVDDLDFVAKVSGSLDSSISPRHVSYKSICPEWEPGIRLTLNRERAWRSFDCSLEYTWMHTDDARSVSTSNGELLAPVLPHPLMTAEGGDAASFSSFARGKWKSGYQTFDLLFSYSCPLASCHKITPFFGIEVLKLDEKIEARYVGEENGLNYITEMKWDCDYRGAGLKVGTDYSCSLCDGLSLFARASSSLIIGDAKASNLQTMLPENDSGAIIEDAFWLQFKDGDCCHIIPGGHFRVGLQYDNECCGVLYSFKIGYEAVALCNVQNPRRWFEFNFGSPSDELEGLDEISAQSNTTTLAFHGLFTGLEFRF